MNWTLSSICPIATSFSASELTGRTWLTADNLRRPAPCCGGGAMEQPIPDRNRHDTLAEHFVHDDASDVKCE